MVVLEDAVTLSSYFFNKPNYLSEESQAILSAISTYDIRELPS